MNRNRFRNRFRNRKPATRAAPATRAVIGGLLLAGLLCVAAAAASAQTAAAPAASAASGATLRAEVGKPLQAAQDAIKAGNFTDGLARLAEAESLPGLTPYERYIIQRLKGPAAFGAGDVALAAGQFEAALASPLMPAAERGAITESTIKLVLQLKDHARAERLLTGYFAAGGNSPEMRRLYPQVLAVLGDHAGVLRVLAPELAADAAAKRSTPEATLRMLAASQNALQDMPAYINTLEQLASNTGKADYWAELMARTVRRDGFAADRLRLDTYRLRRAIGLPLDAAELGDMANLAQLAGLPAEAQALLDDGFSSGLLGQDSNAAADKKLREASTKAAAQDRSTLADAEASGAKAKDGNVAQGLALALSASGAHERALALMALAQSKGGLRRPDEVLLHQGLVQWRAGKIDEAKRTFGTVRGTDGSADLARLWGLYLNSPARK